MNRATLKERKTVNRTISACVSLHLALMVFANRFEYPVLVHLAIWSAPVLYLLFGPILWLWHRTTLPGRIDEGFSDIRTAVELANSLPKYDPEPYFDAARGIFTGMAIKQQKPVYMPWKEFRKTHMQVCGTTGVGKGVATTMLLAQCAIAQECVIILDPKDDEFAPNVLKRIADNHGIPFYLIDLRPSAPPQFNLFRNCTETEILEILMTAFNMGDQGNASDFYRLFDRAAARDVCALALKEGGPVTMRSLVVAANKSSAIDDEKGIKFKADLEELAGLAAIDTTEGHDLNHILTQNCILYVIGSIRNVQTVRCQKMLLLRLLQIIEQRDRTKAIRPVAMMLDELKYLLSKAALQALGTVRDKSCHIMLAHQSIADLRDCEGLDPEAVSGAVVENTSLKLIYKAVSPDTAEWAAALSGTIVVAQQSSHMQQGMFHAAEGQRRETERALLTENDIYTMPILTGMLFGAGLAKRVQVGHMQSGPRPQIIPASNTNRVNSAGKDIDPFAATGSSTPIATAVSQATDTPPMTDQFADDIHHEHAQKPEQIPPPAQTETATDLEEIL